MTLYQPVRGTHDFFGPSFEDFQFIIESAKQTSKRYGYTPIATPIFEHTHVFTKPLGDTSDIVGKEMYTFEDRGGDSLTLRPEGTAPVVRALISNGLLHDLPQKVFYHGPMFRYERPQKGRFRQFHHIGVECIGVSSPFCDVEGIALAWDLLTLWGLGTSDVQLNINTLGDPQSRIIYRAALVEYFKQYENDLSPDSKRRLITNPLRILDSKDEKDIALSAGAPKLKESLSDASREFFETVLKGLDDLNIPYHVNDRLVRGLDYYNHTVFEYITTSLGAQGTVLAGGRYDGLVHQMGGPDLAGFGWAAGIERLVAFQSLPPRAEPQKISVIPMSQNEWSVAFGLTHTLRQNHFIVDIDFSGNASKRLKKANKKAATYALLIGEDEIAKNIITVRHLVSGAQTQIDFHAIVDYLKLQG